VRGAALAQRRVRPLYPLLMIGLGAGIFVPGITSPDNALPEAVRLYVGLPLFVAGIALMAWAGQAVVLVTGGAVYVVSAAAFPGQAPRLLASAPLTQVDLDPARGVAAVGSERLWPLPFRRRSLLELAALLPDGRASVQEPPRRRRRWLIGVAAGLGILFAVLVVIGAVTETDEEQIEETVAGYNRALAEGEGESACERLTARARRQVVEAATSAVGTPPDPPQCAAAVEAVFENAGGAVPDANPNVLLDVEVRDERATAKAGAPFAYQTLPLVKEDGGWRLADLRRPWTMRDAPASDPPEPVEFAVRAQAVCANVSRLAIPVSARLVSAADPQGDPAGQLRQLARLDEELAERLAGLTPPAGDAIDLEPILDALREIADLREGVADAFESRDDREVRRLVSRFEPARRKLVEAVRQAGLANALAVCAS
jgi:hypothetical protein